MIREVLGWWLHQLADLLPEAWRRFGTKGGDATIISPAGPLSQNVDTVIVNVRRRGEETSAGRFRVGAPELTAIPRSPEKSVILRLGQADILAKTLTLPLAAERQLDQAIAFEMDRETPFGPDEVFWSRYIARRDRHAGQLSVRLLLVPRTRLAGLLQALDAAGIRPRQIEIADGPEQNRTVPIAADSAAHDAAPHSLLWAAAIGCVALALTAIAVPFVRQAVALGSVERQIAADRGTAAEARKLRQQIDRLSGGADLIEGTRTNGGQPLAVLAALTRMLPPDTYLTDFVQQNGKVTLAGRSASASRLIAILAAAQQLRNPTFAAPVTRIAANQPEVFTITAEIVP